MGKDWETSAPGSGWAGLGLGGVFLVQNHGLYRDKLGRDWWLGQIVCLGGAAAGSFPDYFKSLSSGNGFKNRIHPYVAGWLTAFHSFADQQT